MSNIDWRPIETAPKDGTNVLLYGIHAGEISGPSDTPSGPHVGRFTDGKSDFSGFDWWVLDEGDGYTCWCCPTHWAPMPNTPEESAAK